MPDISMARLVKFIYEWVVPSDFRTQLLSLNAISKCGRYTARTSYWRLYAIENIVRIITHSVLTIQINPGWWSFAVSSPVDNKVRGVKADYHNQPRRSNPGNHNIYYLFLPDLTKIVSVHANLFRPIIPDIDTWIARLEEIRLPRNIVGHMNWLNNTDKTDVRSLYRDLRRLHRQLKMAGVNLIIP
jgi:hypothetical protein